MFFFSTNPPRDIISAGYSRTPFTTPGTILKVKQWKSKTQYDLMLKEQFAREAAIKRATDERIKQEEKYWSSGPGIGPVGKGNLGQD